MHIHNVHKFTKTIILAFFSVCVVFICSDHSIRTIIIIVLLKEIDFNLVHFGLLLFSFLIIFLYGYKLYATYQKLKLESDECFLGFKDLRKNIRARLQSNL